MSQIFRQKAINSVKWTTLIEFVSKISRPIVTIILAKILTPEDFGVMTCSLIIINLSQLVLDAGLEKSLIQTDEHIDKAANITFWSSIFLGFILFFIIYLGAPLFSFFFDSPLSTNIIRVLSFLIIFSSLTSVQKAFLKRDFEFYKLFKIELVTSFSPFLITIPLAIMGLGVWALVAGALASTFINLVMLWVQSPWRPTLSFDIQVAKKIFSFSLWVTSENIFSWFFNWGDNLIVAKFIGIEALGIYTIGFNLCSMFFSATAAPIFNVLYPTLSRTQDDKEAFTRIFNKVNRIIITITLPMGIGLFFTGPQIADIIFGAKWQGLGQIISLIGLMMGFGYAVAVNPIINRAIGRPDINTKMMFFTVLIYLPAFIFAAPYGIKIFTLTRLFIGLLVTPIWVYILTRLLDISFSYLYHQGKSAILASIILSIILASYKWILSLETIYVSGLFNLFTCVFLGITVYLGSLWLFDKSYIIQLKELAKRATFVH